jgi:modulator of FtsH protease
MDHDAKLGSWGELYVMLGTSSAALMGLLFVAISLHVDEVVKNEIVRIRSRNITIHLIATLLQAAAILTPQSSMLLGVELLMINLLGLWPPLAFTYRAFIQDREAGKRGGFSIYRALNYMAGYLIGAGGSAAMIAGLNWGLYLVTVSYVNALVVAAWNAWIIILGIGRAEKDRVR